MAGGYGKIPQRPPGRWQERQMIAERFASEGWDIQRRWRRIIGISTGSLVMIVASTAAVSGVSAWMLAFGYSFKGGALRQSSVEQLMLKRMLVETSPEQLEQACRNAVRIGAGPSGSGGWKVCLDTPLGNRWEKAHKAPGGGGELWETVGAGSTGLAGSAWVGRTPVHCRSVSIGIGIDPIFDVEMALRHDCAVDVFDLGVDIYRNDFQQAQAGWQGRIKFHSRGLSEREGAVSANHIKHFELVRSNATELADTKSLHPGYDIVAQGPGWSYEGHSGSDWRMKSQPANTGTAKSRAVAPLATLLERAEPAHCEHMLSEGSAGCQVDLLKIDCGSCEWSAFRQLWEEADARVLAQVDQVLVEAHLSDLQTRLQLGGDVWKMLAILQSSGFDLFSVEPSGEHAHVWPAPWGYGSAPSVIRLGWVRRRRAPARNVRRHGGGPV